MPKAQRIQIPIVGQQSVSRSVVVNNQATINFIQAIKGHGNGWRRPDPLRPIGEF